MNTQEKIARWHWRANAAGKEYEFRLIYRFVPADEFPFIEGHQFNLEWRDLFFPDGVGERSKERYITEDFRRDILVVRAHGAAGVPVWTERIDGDLSVQISLAAPEQRFGDNTNSDTVFRVSYQHGSQRSYVARYDPTRSPLSVVTAGEFND